MKNTILKSWGGQWPVIRATKTAPLGEGVIDQSAFNAMEVDQLFDTVNYAQTTVGQATLYRSLAQPMSDREQILAKQQAVEEIRDQQDVRDNIESIVGQAAAKEKHLYVLLFGEFLGSFGTAKEDNQIEGYGYRQYRRAVNFVLSFVAAIQASNAPNSPYLKDLFDKILTFSQSRTYSLMRGPAYHSEQGFQSKEERKGSFVPAIIFKPQLFKPILIACAFFLLWALVYFFPGDMFNFSESAIPTASVFLAPILLAYIPIVGSYDRDNCIIPLRDIYKHCDDLAEALDALGQLDELLAIIKYAEATASETVMPELIESSKHSLNLNGAKNPVLAHKNADYVANDVELVKTNLLFITGPNSGGKTALCKTLTQIQLLAQIGCVVTAKQAILSVADRIYYQTPEISHLEDGEGRFGTELKRTRDIFINSSAISLVVLDEMAEGTTFEEKMESSAHVLDGFYRKGNNTILITHNHQLVDQFVNQGIGQAKQVEFSDEQPTYKLIDGISRVSHADRVAKKIGFSKEDIDHYLEESK